MKSAVVFWGWGWEICPWNREDAGPTHVFLRDFNLRVCPCWQALTCLTQWECVYIYAKEEPHETETLETWCWKDALTFPRWIQAKLPSEDLWFKFSFKAKRFVSFLQINPNIICAYFTYCLKVWLCEGVCAVAGTWHMHLTVFCRAASSPRRLNSTYLTPRCLCLIPGYQMWNMKGLNKSISLFASTCSKKNISPQPLLANIWTALWCCSKF